MKTAVISAYGAASQEHGVVHESRNGRVTVVRVGHPEDVAAGGGTLIRIPEDATLVSVKDVVSTTPRPTS